MNIVPIKAFSDNYIWLLEEATQAVVVDPGEAQGVLDYINTHDLTLTTLLLTHNHDDHIGGVQDIIDRYPEITIYGPQETANLATEVVADGDQFELFGQTVKVVRSEGHTRGHISYIMEDKLFCGDAMFSGGCGRVFTGDYQAQYDALQTFKALDDDVKVYAAHEYTQTNLRFALSVQPDNALIKEALEKANKVVEAGQPTLPTTISREKDINLFLQAKDLAEFIELRNGRDNF